MASDISPAGAQSRSTRVLAALTVAALLAAPLAVLADEQRTYVWRDRDGTVRFTSSPPTQQAAKNEAVDTDTAPNPKAEVEKL